MSCASPRGVVTSDNPWNGGCLLTAGEWRARGVSERQLRKSAYVRVLQGVYARADAPPALATVCLVMSRRSRRPLVFGHATAALLLGIPIPWEWEFATAHQVRVCAVPDSPPIKVTGTRTTRARVHSTLRTPVGVVIASPVDVLCQLAGDLTHAQLVAAIDAVLNPNRVARGASLTRAQLEAEIGARRGMRGIKAVRRAARDARLRVDSVPETIVRLLVRDFGLPEPEINFDVRDPRTGTVRYRLDLAWPEQKVAIEYDGAHHRSSADQRSKDIQRTNWLIAHGWVIAHIVKEDLAHPRRVLERILAAFATQRTVMARA